MKAPQRITHIRRLVNTAEIVRDFFKVAKVLRGRAGPVLFQLPPNFKKDVPRLGDFLATLPKGARAAFEFRHPSWMDAEVFELLRKRQVAICNADGETAFEVPPVATAPWGYYRLRRLDYGDKDLKKWIKRIRNAKWTEAFVFFKHEDTGVGAKFAERFLKLLK